MRSMVAFAIGLLIMNAYSNRTFKENSEVPKEIFSHSVHKHVEGMDEWLDLERSRRVCNTFRLSRKAQKLVVTTASWLFRHASIFQHNT
ncbi:hypothetical protein IQ06DRAFT_5342 [Phaeosphaeriaceae sp. SRC1lsM3a]|nr:hypothetical protein IQ06DRAFT_5342 [Stagonospora sp. SRC1lsM3a]